MAKPETALKVLMAATDLWLRGRELPLVDLTDVPQALWMLQGAVEDIHHHLENDPTISEGRLIIYEEALKNADLLMAFMGSQPEHVQAALKDELDSIEEVLYKADRALNRKVRPWLL